MEKTRFQQPHSLQVFNIEFDCPGAIQLISSGDIKRADICKPISLPNFPIMSDAVSFTMELVGQHHYVPCGRARRYKTRYNLSAYPLDCSTGAGENYLDSFSSTNPGELCMSSTRVIS